MQRLRTTPFNQSLRYFSTKYSKTPVTPATTDKIIASVLFERLPVVIPKIHPTIYAFQEFSFRWNQQYRREYPEEFYKKYESRGQGNYQIDYQPAPRITEADKSNDRRSLNRALDRRLYLLLHGPAYGSDSEKPVWHFPEKRYDNEDTLRKCAESALESVLGDLTHTYFVGNAPMAHIPVTAEKADSNPMKRFFFKSQVIGATKFDIAGCDDYLWVTKDELLEIFPEESYFFNRMIIS